MRYVLIGSGVAAIGAAEAIRQRDMAGEIIMLAEDPFVYYSRPGLAYYLTGEIDERLLFPFAKKDFQRLNIRVLRAAARHIQPEAHVVTLHDGTQLSYDRLLLATGARARPLQVPGTDLQGVFKLDHLQDARAILKHARRRRTAVVTGGGITALELVEGLLARGMRVHYILRGERYWNRVLDPTESHIVETLLEEDGVNLHHRTEIRAILGKRGRVKMVELSDGSQIKADLVAYAVGILPRTELAQAAGLRCERGILVDEHLRTSAADVFAAGDVAQVYDPSVGRYVIDSLWAPAREQGWTAGANMAGDALVYRKAAPFNVTRLAGLTTTIIGAVGSGGRDEELAIVRGDSETWRELPDAIVAQTGFEINRLRLMVGEKHILGAVVMGDQALSPALQRMVSLQVDISPIRSRLLAANAPVAQVLADFWAQLAPTM